MNNRLSSVSKAVMVALLFINPSLSAQEQSEDSEQAKRKSLEKFEVIVVTAQKRQQSISNVGMSVNAFSENQIEALGLDEATDVLNFTPGATITYLAQNSPIYTIRGIGFDDASANSTSTVGVNIDEVALPYPILTRSPQFDLQRIEVLKGPQGTLYGRNTTGGAVNIILNKPEDYDTASITAGFDSAGAWSINGYLNKALSENVAGRLSYYTKQGGAWQKNAAAGGEGQENGDADINAFRAQLSWNINDDMTLAFMTEYHADKSENQIPKFAGIAPANNDGYISVYVTSLINNSSLPDLNRSESVSWDPDGNTFFGLNPGGRFGSDNSGVLTSLRFSWDMEDMEFTSLTSYNDYSRNEANAWDGVEFSNWDSFNNTDLTVWSQEFRLTSAADGKFTWIAGLYFAGDELNEVSVGSGAYASPNFFIVPDDIGPAFGLPTSDLNGDGVVDILDVHVAGLGFDLFSNDYAQTNKTTALFVHTEYKLADDWNLTAALRYTEDENEIKDSCTYDVDGTLASFFSVALFGGEVAYERGDCMTINPATFTSERFNKTITSDNLSGKVGLDWQASEDVLVYSNVSTGYKSGGYGATAASTWEQLDSYKPEEVTSYELGFKASFSDNMWQVNSAVFYYDYSDKQVQAFVFDEIFGALSKIVNAPKSTVSGAELEVNYYPADLTMIRFTSSYLDTEYNEFTAILWGSTSTEGTDISGQRLQNTPEFQHNLMFHHEIDFSDTLYGFIGGDINYSSEYFTLVGGDSRFFVDSYALLNLRAGIGDHDGIWKATAWVKNATDQDYYNSKIPTNDTVVNFMGRERRFGVTIQYNWE